MNAQTRARLTWLVVGIAALYALVSSIAYFAQGTFTTPWLVAGIAVYGAVLGAAIILALIEPAAVEIKTVPIATPPGEPELLERAVVYRTTIAMAVRLTYLWPDGSREVRLIAFTPGEALPSHDIEAHLDAFPRVEGPREIQGDVDALLAKKAYQGIPVMTQEVTP
jgi:hypothetical protein